jgi:hypothetical protein
MRALITSMLVIIEFATEVKTFWRLILPAA